MVRSGLGDNLTVVPLAGTAVFLLVFRASSRLGPDKHERRYTKRTKVMRECEIYTQTFPAQQKEQKKPRSFEEQIVTF